MTLPVLTVDQKFQIRDIQLKLMSINENIRSLTQRAQMESQKLHSIVEGVASQSGYPSESLIFDIENLEFQEKKQSEVPTPKAPETV